uniref:Uncharacterized protein n=2 Tax=viral metagenome TaxID=1070528 RepID=A0A6M3KVA4_9ZZZZ
MPVLDRLRSLVSTGKALGLEDDEGPIDKAKSLATLQNIGLRNLALSRELSEPSSHEVDMAKFTFNKLKDIMLDPSTSPASKEHYGELLKRQFFGFSPQLREILAPLAKGTPLDPMEQKAMAFDRMNPPLSWPTNKDGERLEETPENFSQIASYKFAELDRKLQREMVVYGVEAGKARAKLPTFVPVGEKYAYRDSSTRSIFSVDPNAMIRNPKQASEWGWSISKMLIEDFEPTGPAKEILTDNGTVSVMPGRKLSTGEFVQDQQFYGQSKEDISSIPEPVLDGMAAYELDLDDKDIKDPEAKFVKQLMKDIAGEKYKNEVEATAAEAQINETLRGRYPKLRHWLKFNREPKGLIFKGIRLADGSFQMITSDRIVNPIAPNGTPVPLHADDQDGTRRDADGKEVPEAKGAEDGDVIDVELETPMLDITSAHPDVVPIQVEQMKSLVSYIAPEGAAADRIDKFGRALQERLQAPGVHLSLEELKEMAKRAGLAAEMTFERLIRLFTMLEEAKAPRRKK